MKVALVGFRGSGKTSVFNALTGQTADTGLGKKSANLGRIQVPDERVDALSAIYEPKKTTYAEIAFIDVAGPETESKSGLDQQLVAQIREADALVHVARGFESAVLNRDPDPRADIAAFEDELILTDLIQVEKRVARLKKEGKRTPELEQLEKIQAHLESGQPLRRLKMEPAELQVIAGFAFLSLKPVLVVLNQAEDQIGDPPPEVLSAASERNLEVIPMSALMETEIMAMEPEDQKAFLEDLGLTAPARARFIQACYRMLDLISFLTVGEDEVRAWTIERGTHARGAAGKIHSDLERGFIRAEVTPSKDLLALGSEAKVREAGKLRLEGKEYVVQDGDIMHIRHSG